jgi:phosphoribosylanthranilate isomerase
VSRTRIKICGVTRARDAAHAVALGADAIGVVLLANGPRQISPQQARAVLTEVQGTVMRVGLFMDAEADRVSAVLDALDLDLLQFHGQESNEFCAAFGRPYLKAVAASQTAVPGWFEQWPQARGFVVDSHEPGQAGGSGKTFDWTSFPGDSVRPLLLAGGLRPDNVATAIARARPWGVDVSSGVESEPGCKDADQMTRFVNEVRRADEHR